MIGFVAANWEAIGHGARLTLLTLALGGFYGAGYHVRERVGTMPRVGEALYVVGVLLFGASLFLVGQMYNVQAHDPLALLLWAAGAAATALVVRSRAIAALAVVLFTGWVGFELGLAVDDADDAFGAFAAGAVFYGAAFYGLSTAGQERFRGGEVGRSGFLEAGRAIGLPVAAAGLFVFTFSDAADELEPAGDALDGGLLAGFVVLAVLAGVGAAALALTRRRSGAWEAAAIVVAVVALVVGVAAGGDGTLYAVLFNVLFAAVALGAVYAGYVTDEPWLVNMGVLFVAVDLVARYFDVFWEALPRSVGLIGAGVVVLALAYLLERQRKRLLERMAT